METTSTFWDNTLKIVAYLAPLGAVFVGIGLERFKARSVTIERFLEFNLISSDQIDPFYGNTRIELNGIEYDNMIVANLELKNTSWVSLKEFTLKIGLAEGMFIGVKAWLAFQDSTIELIFTDKHRDEINRLLAIPEEEHDDLFFANRNHINRHREYVIPHLNKGDKIIFEFLFSVHNRFEPENLIVFPFHENIKISTVKDSETIKKEKLMIINIIAALIFLACSFPISSMSRTINQAVWIMVVNSITCYLFAWLFWFIGKFFRDIFIK